MKVNKRAFWYSGILLLYHSNYLWLSGGGATLCSDKTEFIPKLIHKHELQFYSAWRINKESCRLLVPIPESDDFHFDILVKLCCIHNMIPVVVDDNPRIIGEVKPSRFSIEPSWQLRLDSSNFYRINSKPVPHIKGPGGGWASPDLRAPSGCDRSGRHFGFPKWTTSPPPRPCSGEQRRSRSFLPRRPEDVQKNSASIGLGSFFFVS